MPRSAFFHDERCLWHVGGLHTLFLPVGVDPLARMMLDSETFRLMARSVMEVAARHAGGRVVAVHEGGYSEAAVPFCGHAVVEELAGESMGVEDPLVPFFALQQPGERFRAFQRQLIDEMAAQFGLG